MEVSTSELREIMARLCDHLEATGQGTVTVPHDYYWFIPETSRYDPYQPPEPGELTLGQISDDLRELRRMVGRQSDPVAYGFVWLSSVLAAVGDTVIG